MQEAELKKKEKARISTEKEKQGRKDEKIRKEGCVADLVVAEKQKVEKSIEEGIALKTLKIPVLQTKPFKEINTKIKAFFTGILEINPITREIPKISIKTKPFRDMSRKILAFNLTVPTIEQKIFNLAVPNPATKDFKSPKDRF